MKDFINFYKDRFNSNIVNMLIGINIIMFSIQAISPLNFQEYLMIPTLPSNFILQPWSIITGMFMHSGFMHIIFNMFWLWQMGNILLAEIGKDKFLKLYMYGGIGASIAVLLYSQIFDLNTYMIGASGAISVIIFAAIFTIPEKMISLFGIINLKMKHIAWALFIFSIIGLFGDNSGGNVAHLIGALIGYVWIKYYLDRDFLKDIFNF